MDGAQRDWSQQSGREAGSAEGLPAILPALLKSAAVNSPGGKKPLAKGKRKDEQIHTTIYKIYKINNKDLLCSTGNYFQHLVKNYNGKESEK